MDSHSRLDDALIASLRGVLRGPVIAPGDPVYDEARSVWNARIDRRPGAIARCTGAADVMAAVRLARDHDILLAVRGGGHSYAGLGSCDDGLVLDLSPMDGVRVDPRAKTARVGAGARWGAVDHETQAFGLATTGGTVSTVGVAGYTLGGGSGHLSRRFGLALDNLRSVDVVTAAGELLRASEHENGDLFWGIRGGAGNFGVVTSFELVLHEVGPRVLAGQVIHRLDDAAGALRFYRDFMASAPDELQCYPFFLRLPPLDELPSGLHGRTGLSLVVVYSGDLDRGEEVLEPLRDFGEPLLDVVAPQPYAAFQQLFDPGMPKGLRWYSKSHYLRDLPDEAIEVVVGRVDSLPTPTSVVYLETQGGSMGRVDPAATAFPHRDAAYLFHVFPGWEDPARDEEIMAWARDFHDEMARWATGGVYVNMLSPDERDRIPAAYGANHERLGRLKREVDPTNLFRVNHNVEPLAD
ncbi:MAG TPA: FAD-binding oxidoreductase [Thermoanaerobaculia bacterium]|nr:FAD-binding oxidoreductase [Thermoanaerobaculia bacterium]